MILSKFLLSILNKCLNIGILNYQKMQKHSNITILMILYISKYYVKFKYIYIPVMFVYKYCNYMLKNH